MISILTTKELKINYIVLVAAKQSIKFYRLVNLQTWGWGGLSCDIYQFTIKSGQVNFELVSFDFVNLIQFLYLK